MQDLCSAYRSIFGLDAELNPAVPDYQMLSVFAKALDDASAFMIAGYNSRNPEYASGQALDLLLPTYGLSRLPGETDAEARARVKKALASLGCCTVDAMEAEIRKVPNVTQILIRVNDENSTVDGIPAHNIAAYSHIPPPNSSVTVHGGWVYNRKARKCVYVHGKGFDKPLFDTGALYNAFDYEIEE